MGLIDPGSVMTFNLLLLCVTRIIWRNRSADLTTCFHASPSNCSKQTSISPFDDLISSTGFHANSQRFMQNSDHVLIVVLYYYRTPSAGCDLSSTVIKLPEMYFKIYLPSNNSTELKPCLQRKCCRNCRTDTWSHLS